MGKTSAFTPAFAGRQAHIHNIVSGGGITSDDKWVKEKRSNGRFLFPRRAMEKIYKGYFLEQLRKYMADGSLKHTGLATVEKILSTIGQKKWNVNAKAPFGGPAQIIEYLGRYTHSPRWIREPIKVFF